MISRLLILKFTLIRAAHYLIIIKQGLIKYIFHLHPTHPLIFTLDKLLSMWANFIIGFQHIYYYNFILIMSNINAWTVLTTSPHELVGEEHHPAQTFFEMIKNLLAPYYKLKSFTTFLIAVSVIVYITLVVSYPPFLKIPTFALESLILLPEHLKHFQFYRLFTSPFVYQDITSLVLGVLLLWCLGSFTQDTIGWKIFSVITGLSGLVGYANSFTLPVFLLGCNFSILIMKWADPNLPILYRKVMFIIYIIVVVIFILMFINYKRQQEFNFYMSALYGFLMTSVLGRAQDSANLTMFRKVLSSFSLIALILISTGLLMSIVFNNKTFI